MSDAQSMVLIGLIAAVFGMFIWNRPKSQNKAHKVAPRKFRLEFPLAKKPVGSDPKPTPVVAAAPDPAPTDKVAQQPTEKPEEPMVVQRGREYDYGTGGQTSVNQEIKGKLAGITAFFMALIIRFVFQFYLSSALMDWRIQGSSLTITAGLWIYGALQDDPEEHHGAVNLALIIWAITMFV